MTASQGARLPGLLPGERSDALSIAALYGRVQAALGRAFPRGRPMWVRGEVQSISDRTGHCYIELVDPDGPRGRDAPVLRVNCWARTWTPLKATLERQGVALEPGLVVTLQGRVEVYPPRGQLNLIATDLDVTALLGRLAARRAALLKALDSEGLLRRNGRLPVPAVPLLIGLVASRGTEGYRDFTGRLHTSGFAFHVLHVPAQVQGVHAPRQLGAGVAALADSGCDLVVVVRGGGSRADLSAFDSEPVARAIAGARVPVWTGIGHTGDQSVADVVANRSFVTPTECGQELVARVATWWGDVEAAVERLGRRATQAMADSLRRDTEARTRLCASARSQLNRHGERLQLRGDRLAAAGPRGAEQASLAVRERARRLRRGATFQLQQEEERVVSWRRLLAAYDVERQLERGYTLTLDEDGRLVQSASALATGDVIVTRFADGRTSSKVQRVQPNREN